MSWTDERVELLRQLGFSYREMESEDNCFFAVAEARCRYRAPVRYDEEVLVRTQLLNVRESVVHFGYELRRAADGALLAEGETTHIVTNAEMKTLAHQAGWPNLKQFRFFCFQQAVLARIQQVLLTLLVRVLLVGLREVERVVL